MALSRAWRCHTTPSAANMVAVRGWQRSPSPRSLARGQRAILVRTMQNPSTQPQPEETSEQGKDKRLFAPATPPIAPSYSPRPPCRPLARAPVWLVPLCLLALAAYRAFRIAGLISTYAVNIPYLDEWDFLPFHGESWVQLFFHQHGPHREGLGLVWQVAMLSLTGWQDKTVAYLMILLLGLATLLALLLTRLITGRLTLADSMLVVLLLTPAQWELIFVIPHAAHSFMPLVFLLAACLAWWLPRRPARYTAVLILNFLATFTGFGFFLAPLTLLLFVAEAIRHRDRLAFLGIAAAAGTLTAFFLGWHFDPANPRFGHVHPALTEYLKYAALVTAHAIGGRGNALSVGIGAVLLLALLTVAVRQGMCLLRTDAPEPRCLFLLPAFTLLFVFNCAYGRASISLGGALASRYVTLVLPGLVALFLCLRLAKPPRIRRYAPWLVLALLYLPCTLLLASDRSTMAALSKGKVLWVQAYRQTGDIDRTDHTAHFKIHPNPAATHLKEKLDFLQRHGYECFARSG